MGELRGLDQEMPKLWQASLHLVPNLSTGYTSFNDARRPEKNWSKKIRVSVYQVIPSKNSEKCKLVSNNE